MALLSVETTATINACLETVCYILGTLAHHSSQHFHACNSQRLISPHYSDRLQARGITIVVNANVIAMSDKNRLQEVLARRALPLPVYGSVGQGGPGRFFDEQVEVSTCTAAAAMPHPTLHCTNPNLCCAHRLLANYVALVALQVHLAHDVTLTSTGRATTRKAAQEIAANTMLQHDSIVQLATGGMPTAHKNKLQEFVMHPSSSWMKRMPAYASLAVGAAGFEERVTIQDHAGHPFTAVGTAFTRKAAQQDAARQLLMAVA